METGRYFLLLDSGAGGFVCAQDQVEAYNRASLADGPGWLFCCTFAGYPTRRRKQRRGPVIELQQVAVLGRPEPNKMPTALASAGERLCTEFRLVLEHEA